MTAIKIKTISMVQLPPAKSQKNLFHVALTNKSLYFLQAFIFLSFFIELGETRTLIHVRRYAEGRDARKYNRIFAKQTKRQSLFESLLLRIKALAIAGAFSIM